MADKIGVDLGSYTIKAALLSDKLNGFELKKLGSVYNPVGQFLPHDEGDYQKLATSIKQLASENGFSGKNVVVGLPESISYSSVISLPNLSEAELASSIHWEAEQHIPVPLEEVNLEYEVLYRPKKGDMGEKMQVLIVAVKKDIVDRLVDMFISSGVDIVGLEPLLLGVYRALHSQISEQDAVAVCHMGALSTDILISYKGQLVLTYAIQSGGLALTRALEKGLQLPPSQAEEYKRAYGLSSEQLEGKVKGVLEQVMGMLLSEIRKALQYYQTSHMAHPVRSMIMTGGSAYMPELTGYLAEKLSMEVALANPLEGIHVKDNSLVPQDVAAYSGAIGLAQHPETT